MIFTAQQQRIPLVDVDQRTMKGIITKEWLRLLQASESSTSSADAATIAALSDALAVAQSQIASLTAALNQLTLRVVALEARRTTSGAAVVQPSPGPSGPAGSAGERGPEGPSPFPAPLTPIPLEWTEELRSSLELSGLY